MNYKLEVLVNYVESLEEKIKDLEKQIEELKKEIENETWIPKMYESYWYVKDNSLIAITQNVDSFNDRQRFKTKNYYKTKEKAEFASEKEIVIGEMKEFSKEYKLEERNVDIYWNYFENDMNFSSSYGAKLSQLYFESAEKIEEMLDAVGRDRVIKYYLGVEDE